MINFPLLTADDICVKVKQVTKQGALLLLYKTARIDAKILDEILGPMNWTDEYVEVKGNLYCKVGIRENAEQPFVYKMDCGIESDQDDGQEKKAEASDAFKRCCSKLGIGRELYSSPQIWAAVATVEKNGKWYLEDKYAKYYVSKIKYDEKSRTIIDLQICNLKTGVVVYEMPTTRKILAAADDLDFDTQESTMVEAKEKEKPATKKSASKTVEKPAEQVKENFKDLVREIGGMVNSMIQNEGSPAKYKAIIKEVTGGDTFKCNTATEDQYDTVLAIRDKLVASGYRG